MHGEGTSSSAGMAARRSKGKNWAEEEDRVLREQVLRHGEQWKTVCVEFPVRTERSCRERWTKRLKVDAATREESPVAADKPPRKRACLELLPLEFGVIVRSTDARIRQASPVVVEELFPPASDDERPAPSWDDGKDDPLTVLRLGPPPPAVVFDAIPLQ